MILVLGQRQQPCGTGVKVLCYFGLDRNLGFSHDQCVLGKISYVLLLDI